VVCQQPLRERRARLRGLIVESPGYVELVKSIDIDLDTFDGEACSESSPIETVVRDFLERAVTSGCEGLMVKTLDGGSSSYRAGMRSYSWMKLKQDYLSESTTESVGSTKSLGSSASKNRDTGAFLPDTLDLVPIGAFYGKGRRTGGFGSFLLATYNSTSGKFEVSTLRHLSPTCHG
jgi:DNA ligase-1